jgi:hypothetical protein
VASLEGDLPDEASLLCPSVGWAFGDVPLQIDEVACAGAPQRLFRTAHNYALPGAYEATVRLLGSGLAASAPVQIIVQGPTPTPAPEAVLGFPPPVTRLTPEEVAGAGGRGGPPGQGSAPDPRGTSAEGVPLPDIATAGTVLPADLVFLAGDPTGAWRRPAGGGTLVAVPIGEPPLVDLAASAAGDLAVVDAKGIAVLSAGAAAAVRLATGAGAAAAPGRGWPGAHGLVWSPDGSRLAWRADGLWLAQRERGSSAGWSVRRAENADGTPLAWDDAGVLSLRTATGSLGLFDAATGTLAAVPVPAGAEAGWLSGRPVAWLAGPGLRLLTVADALQLTPLLEEASVRAVAESPPATLRALLGQGDSFQAVTFDLRADSLRPVPTGRAFDAPAGRFAAAWAPDGSHLVLASAAGLQVVDVDGARGPERLVNSVVTHAVWVRQGVGAP